jgi:hypothetical protein
MLDEIEGRIWVAHHEALNHLLGRAGRRAAETLILTRRDVCRLMDAAAWLDAAEAGFRAAADGRASAPPPMTIEAQDGAFHAKAARCTLGCHYVAPKLNGNFPAIRKPGRCRPSRARSCSATATPDRFSPYWIRSR